MRAFNNRNNGRANSSCGYCRQTGHAISDCPYIEYDRDEWAAHRVPHKSPSIQHCRWFMSDYSYWMKQINKYYPKWRAAQERKKNKGKPKAQRTTAPKKCGFCATTGHTRRNCPTMNTFTTKLKEANANFRQSYYDTIVKNLGLGIGAAVKVKIRRGYSGDSEEVIGIVDQFDLSSLNIFSVNSNMDSDYRGLPEIMVSVGNQRYAMNLSVEDTSSRYSHTKGREDSQGRVLTATGGYYYNSVMFTSTVAPSTKPLDESWVSNEALADEFEWVTKKRSEEWLEGRGVPALVEAWK